MSWFFSHYGGTHNSIYIHSLCINPLKFECKEIKEEKLYRSLFLWLKMTSDDDNLLLTETNKWKKTANQIHFSCLILLFSWSGRFLIWNWSFLIIDNRLEFVVVVKILFILIVYYCHFHVCLLVYWKFKNEYFSFSSLDYNHWKHWNEFQSNFLLSACYHCLMFIFNWIYCDTVDDMMVVVDHFFFSMIRWFNVDHQPVSK